VLLSTLNISAPQRGHCVSDTGAAGLRRELGLNQEGHFISKSIRHFARMRQQVRPTAAHAQMLIADFAELVAVNYEARR